MTAKHLKRITVSDFIYYVPLYETYFAFMGNTSAPVETRPSFWRTTYTEYGNVHSWVIVDEVQYFKTNKRTVSQNKKQDER